MRPTHISCEETSFLRKRGQIRRSKERWRDLLLLPLRIIAVLGALLVGLVYIVITLNFERGAARWERFLARLESWKILHWLCDQKYVVDVDTVARDITERIRGDIEHET